MARVERFQTTDTLMAGAAEHFVSAATRAFHESGRFVVALAGGSTPKRLYALLATPAYAGRVDWSRTHLFWGDERAVPPDAPASNYCMTREVLLDHVPVPAPNVHRIRGEDAPEKAAAAYERELRQTFATPEGPPSRAPGRRFDLVLLGMGDNGHTASLFPGLAAVREKERWVVAEQVAEVSMCASPDAARRNAAQVVFLVSGAEKAAMLHQVLEGPSSRKTFRAGDRSERRHARLARRRRGRRASGPYGVDVGAFGLPSSYDGAPARGANRRAGAAPAIFPGPAGGRAAGAGDVPTCRQSSQYARQVIAVVAPVSFKMIRQRRTFHGETKRAMK
jgi:6-phosphogluconolactonase